MIAALCIALGFSCPPQSSMSLGLTPDYSLDHSGSQVHCIRELGGEETVLLKDADYRTFTVARERLRSEGVSVDELKFGCGEE